MYLEKINSPQDVRKLSIEQLDVLAGEIREGVLNRVSNHGGHVGPNLGITEATIALVYVLTFLRTKSCSMCLIRFILIRCLQAALTDI